METEECKVAWSFIHSDFSSPLICHKQLKLALQVIGRNPSDRAIGKYWNQCGGSMNYQRFCQVVQMEGKTKMADLLRAFKKIDINGDGFIIASELQRKLTKQGEKMSMEEIESVIAEVDKDGDGRLDYGEFCHLLLNTADNCLTVVKSRVTHAYKKEERPRSHKSHTSLTNAEKRGSLEHREKQKEDIRKQLHSSEGLTTLSQASMRKRLSQQHSDRSFRDSRAALPLVSSFVTSQFQSATNGSQLVEDDRVHIDQPLPLATNITQSTSLNKTSAEKSDEDSDRWTSDSALTQQQVIPLPARLPPLGETPVVPVGMTNSVHLVNDEKEPLENKQDRVLSSSSLVQDGQKTGSDKEDEADKNDGTELARNIIYVSENGGGAGNGKEGGVENGQEAGAGNGQEGRAENGQEGRAGNDKQGGAVSGEENGTEADNRSKVEESEAVKKENDDKDARRESNEMEQKEVEAGLVHKEEDNGLDQISEDTTRPVADTEERLSSAGSQKDKPRSAPAPASCVTTPPPRKPKNIQVWHCVPGKGCFYVDHDSVNGDEDCLPIKCHHYQLRLSQPTNVWIEVAVAEHGIADMDVLLFICRINEKEEVTDVITYTQHMVGQKWVCRMDLESGVYALLPYTSGCHLRASEDENHEAKSLVTQDTHDSVALTEEAKAAFTAVFNQIDLDGNGAISRTEFDFFNEITSGEICDDEAWGIIQANFTMTEDDEITELGFLGLQEMAAGDEDGGESELWQCLHAMGYDTQLKLCQACPFMLDVWSEECEGELEIVDMLPQAPILNYALCLWVVEGGMALPVQGVDKEDEEGPFVYLFNSSKLTTIVVENKSEGPARVQLDVSQSVNCICNRESTVHVVELSAQERQIGYHLQPADVQLPHSVHCLASKILS